MPENQENPIIAPDSATAAPPVDAVVLQPPTNPIQLPAESLPAAGEPAQTGPVDISPAADNLPVINNQEPQPLETVTAPVENPAPVPVITAPPLPNPPPVAAPAAGQTPIALPPQAADQKFTVNFGKWKEHLAQALAKKQQVKQEKLLKILALAQKENKITNQQVKKLLRCTGLTAWRYLKLLEKQNLIKRTGGHNTPTYELEGKGVRS
ncbi:MAG: hypothetical protein P4L74_05725 [Candidatus Doudnabacteria bacterium]|nr:hypothetical protein [Candidatus Doudnabacteria bacterium]